VHLGALSASQYVDRITLYGRNAEARARLQAEFPQVCRATDNLHDIWDDQSIQVAHVVLPHDLHAPTAVAALESGKHVICEKPAATNLADFDRVKTAADRTAKRFLVVMNQLYNPLVLTVQQLMEKGAIGRPFLAVENSYTRHGHNYLDPWRTTLQRAGGGVLIDGGYHLVYKHLAWLSSFGSPQWVNAVTDQLNLNPAGLPDLARGEDAFAATVGLGPSLRIQWSHAWTLAANLEVPRQCFVAGTEGTLETTNRVEAPLILHLPEEVRSISVPEGPRTGPETTHACLLDYLESLATHRPPKFGTIALARQTLALIEAIYASARSHAPLRF